MHGKEKVLVDLSTQIADPNWLAVLPITEFGFKLSKYRLWDSIKVRYGWETTDLPTTCPCGNKFDIQHSMSCKKGNVIFIWHNDSRELTTNMMLEVCKDTETEPKKILLSREELHGRMSNNSSKAKVDIK